MNQETIIRLSVFLGVFAVFSLLEMIKPRRKLKIKKSTRWANNLAHILLNNFFLRFVITFMPVTAAVYAQEWGWGLFNQINLPPIFIIISSVVILDFIIYLQHVIFHKVPVFWRLHRMHHSDQDVDITTSLRFHFIEIMLSLGIKIGFVFLLGATPISVILFESILNGLAMFNHSNIYIPLMLDKYIRLLIVTPDMHRIHHSVVPKETDSNFGFNLSIWDRLFKTYTDQPEKGHLDMDIGLMEFKDPKYQLLHWMLLTPFVKTPEIKNNR